MRWTLLLLFCCLSRPIFSQNPYSYWLTGSAADVSTPARPGLLLAGGGTDNDDAMRWLLQLAGGGDVVVIRASGSNGYNDYLFQELGVVVNSVETIRFDSPLAAQDSFVINCIRGAEVLFIAGGDQYAYLSYWQGTPIEDAIHYLIHEKRIAIGGTSAGMAILGEFFYAPSGTSATSLVALATPFHPTLDGLGSGNFIDHPVMEQVITDSHYAQRNRQGRHFVFMARLAALTAERVYGIACNESTAVAIDEQRMARVFGEFPQYADHAYFLQTNCEADFLPELLQPGSPITWNRGMAAVKVYKLPGTTGGSNWFDLNSWLEGSGGSWEHWWANNGSFAMLPGSAPDCSPSSLHLAQAEEPHWFPNPATDWIQLRLPEGGQPLRQVELINLMGQQVAVWSAPASTLSLQGIPPGHYILRLHEEASYNNSRIVILRP